MKKYLLFSAVMMMALVSCNTVKTPFSGNDQFEVSSTLKRIPVPDVAASPAPAEIILPAETEEVSSNELNVNELLFAMESTETDNETAADAMKMKMATDLREAAKTLDSRIAQRIVNKTANRVESSTSARMEEMGFIQKMYTKVFGKMISKRASSARMDLADIFAIVSISAGGAAFLAYYGSFFFGVAAIVFGIIALVQGTNRRGMAIAGIALGATAIFLWTLFFAWWAVL